MPRIAVSTGVTLNYEISGEGEPLLLITGTSVAIPLWGGLLPQLARRHRVIAFDNRGLGGSERGDGPISVASLAEDASALLEALDVPKAHMLGWSRCDGFQRSVLSALRLPYAVGDMEAALAVSGIAFSPQLLDHPDFAAMLEPMLPAFPRNAEQIAVTVEQWDADLAHDTLDRLGGIAAPTLVVVGEQDLLTPPWQSKAVADAIPGARYELVTGPGSSHGMHVERPDDLARIALGFLAEHPLRG